MFQHISTSFFLSFSSRISKKAAKGNLRLVEGNGSEALEMNLFLVELLQNGIEVVVGWYVEMVETKEFFTCAFKLKTRNQGGFL